MRRKPLAWNPWSPPFILSILRGLGGHTLWTPASLPSPVMWVPTAGVVVGCPHQLLGDLGWCSQWLPALPSGMWQRWGLCVPSVPGREGSRGLYLQQLFPEVNVSLCFCCPLLADRACQVGPTFVDTLFILSFVGKKQPSHVLLKVRKLTIRGKNLL